MKTTRHKNSDEILAKTLKRIGGAGAGWVAKLLPDNVFEMAVEVAAAADEIDAAIRHAIGEENILAEAEASTDGFRISAVVESGFGGLNPTLLSIHLKPQSERLTTATIRGVAKEGLIKQRAGEQAVRALAEWLLAVKWL